MISTTLKIHAQSKDTLANVKVFSKKPLDITTTSVSVQQLNKTDLERLNSVSVADAVKYFSGVVIKDYGGIGGLKTISVRSLGANHTAVMYDGIVMSDAQGGQIDLGRLSLDNIESIQLFNGQPVDILLPARSYASTSVLSLSSSVNNSKETQLSLKLKGGSFGFIDPAVSYKSSIGNHFRHGINAEYQSADGSYSFIDYETGQTEKKRNNADIKSYRLEYDAAYYLSDSNKIRLKLYYYNSKRGLPGAVILYNNLSTQRLDIDNFFGQINWQKNFSAKSRVLISGKFATDHKYYLDPSYPNSAGKLENNFHQQEIYFSAAYSYKIFPSLTACYSSDYFKNTLKRTDQFAQGFANPERDNFLNNLSVQFKQKRFDINGNIIYTVLKQKVEAGPTAKNMQEVTPGAAASVQPFQSLPVRVRFFYKRIFRAPTFDDLYYTNIGNTDLRPEYTNQYNLGLTYNLQTGKFIKGILFTADAYYNKVKDRILAVPRQNLFQWTMLNIGKVEIKGVDVAAHMSLREWKGINISSNFTYSFQSAQDVSDPLSTLYRSQLPYTPKHSGSVNLSVDFKKLSFSYNILSSSYRYQLGDPIPANVVQGWATHDITLSYKVSSKKYCEYKFLAEANNIYNKQYEIIKYYPMPRFNYRLGIIVSLNK